MWFKFNLYKNDCDILEDFEEVEELKVKINTLPLDIDKYLSVHTDNIDLIIGRDEILSLFMTTKKELLKNHCIISVSEPFKKESDKKIDIECHDLLQLEFTDIRKEFSEEYLLKNKDFLKLITEEQISNIKDFILKNRDKKFIINCDVGISRSSAIGIFLEHLIGTKENIQKIHQHRRYDPNKILLRKFNIDK